ncbi:hypothetical protein DFH06DRAFT_1291222 [Mycena polygramma]|nr:hypothetical protein DFH06DRAFT_1291222 [Mycena polygramma]
MPVFEAHSGLFYPRRVMIHCLSSCRVLKRRPLTVYYCASAASYARRARLSSHLAQLRCWRVHDAHRVYPLYLFAGVRMSLRRELRYPALPENDSESKLGYLYHLVGLSPRAPAFGLHDEHSRVEAAKQSRHTANPTLRSSLSARMRGNGRLYRCQRHIAPWMSVVYATWYHSRHIIPAHSCRAGYPLVPGAVHLHLPPPPRQEPAAPTPQIPRSKAVDSDLPFVSKLSRGWCSLRTKRARCRRPSLPNAGVRQEARGERGYGNGWKPHARAVISDADNTPRGAELAICVLPHARPLLPAVRSSSLCAASKWYWYPYTTSCPRSPRRRGRRHSLRSRAATDSLWGFMYNGHRALGAMRMGIDSGCRDGKCKASVGYLYAVRVLGAGSPWGSFETQGARDDESRFRAARDDNGRDVDEAGILSATRLREADQEPQCAYPRALSPPQDWQPRPPLDYEIAAAYCRPSCRVQGVLAVPPALSPSPTFVRSTSTQAPRVACLAKPRTRRRQRRPTLASCADAVPFDSDCATSTLRACPVDWVVLKHPVVFVLELRCILVLSNKGVGWGDLLIGVAFLAHNPLIDSLRESSGGLGRGFSCAFSTAMSCRSLWASSLRTDNGPLGQCSRSRHGPLISPLFWRTHSGDSRDCGAVDGWASTWASIEVPAALRYEAKAGLGSYLHVSQVSLPSMFHHCSNFIITGDFHLIPAADLNLLTHVDSDEIIGEIEPWETENTTQRLGVVGMRKVYRARIFGHQDPMTAIVYEGSQFSKACFSAWLRISFD